MGLPAVEGFCLLPKVVPGEQEDVPLQGGAAAGFQGQIPVQEGQDRARFQAETGTFQQLLPAEGLLLFDPGGFLLQETVNDGPGEFEGRPDLYGSVGADGEG